MKNFEEMNVTEMIETDGGYIGPVTVPVVPVLIALWIASHIN